MVVLNLQNPWVKRVISISFIIIVAFSGYLLARLTWEVIVKPSVLYSSDIILPKQTVKSSAGVSDATKANRIADVHVFGQFKEPRAENIPEETKPVAKAKKTPLNFVLMSRALSSTANGGWASIAEGKTIAWFKVGDDVFEKATLYAVYDEHVEFERDNGDIEILEFTSDKKSKSANFIATERGANLGSEFDYKQPVSTNKTYSRPVSSLKESANDRIKNTPRSNELADIVTNVSSVDRVKKIQESINTDSKTKNSVERYVNKQITKAKSNPVSTLTQYGLKFIPGKGYEVTSRARDLMLLGLRAGDIIITINGHSATSPEQDIKLIDEVMASGEILIEYERNGKVLVMKQALLQF